MLPAFGLFTKRFAWRTRIAWAWQLDRKTDGKCEGLLEFQKPAGGFRISNQHHLT